MRLQRVRYNNCDTASVTRSRHAAPGLEMRTPGVRLKGLKSTTITGNSKYAQAARHTPHLLPL